MTEAPRIDWSEVESANFTEYARKLRQAGFPPGAVRDALLPEILTHYAKLVGEQAKYAISPRWAGISEETEREHRQAWERLKEERKHLVEFLFGIDPERVELYKPWAFGVRQEEFPSLRDDLREHLEKLKRERTQARAALVARGLTNTQVMAELEPLIRSQEAEMKGFLPQDVYDRVTSSR
ncbi:MAG TPA: hypothetical protein VHI52_19530 [Verrucomicrobiae bacterium]|nr:hypothetical protein [Verrucomicrobiae bacterium]